MTVDRENLGVRPGESDPSAAMGFALLYCAVVLIMGGAVAVAWWLT